MARSESDAADVDERAAARPQVRARDARAVDDAPVVRLEHAPVVFGRHFEDAPVDRDARRC